MSKIFKQISIALISVVSLLTISNASWAAKFAFSLNDSPGYRGTLEFNNSQLTGIGTESINLKQLTNAQYYFPSTSSGRTFYTNSGDIVFDFYNGQLSGVRTVYYEVIRPTGWESWPSWAFSMYPMTSDSGTLYLKGQTWSEEIYYYTGRGKAPGSGYSSGTISFQTLEPIASNSVPEPSTVLGVALGVAGIMGLRPRFR